jgi:hypothetical protein
VTNFRHKKIQTSLDFFILAMTYFPVPLPEEYRRRDSVSLLCSGWEEVVPLCYNHQILSLKIFQNQNLVIRKKKKVKSK